MTATIWYETADGTDSIERDEWHDEKDGFVTAYNDSDGNGVDRKVTFPIQRIVRIDANST